MSADPQWLLFAPPLLLSLVAVAGLMASDFHRFQGGRFIFKPLATMAFIWLALLGGALESPYGRLLLLGLVLSALGDLLLMSEAQAAFLTGLLAFLCGHLMYLGAFLQLPLERLALGLSLPPALALAGFTLRWLRPQLQGAMRIAVPAYILVITAMLVTAGGTWGQPGARWILGGAWGFALSDLAVARRQFVADRPIDGLWGTPLYFGSQMLLAASVAVAAG